MMEKQQHCKDLLASLSDYVDGELNSDLCSDLEKHLSECENCRVVVNTMKKTIEIYHHHAHTEAAPVDVKQRLFTKLNLADYRVKKEE
ncbi:MAG: anti-sigma factor [Chloroflexi bacterium HGW-Chloroflexi-10]|nr:MAG: anti-sigma factor [Chloroflexi bacterium HGW-Chloroflexi-10]